MSPSNEDEGIGFHLGELPQEVTEAAADEIGTFSCPLLLDQQFIGSATLLKFGNTFGFLTAEHVVNNPYNRSLSIDTSADSTHRLGTTVGSYAHNLSVETRYLEIEKTDRLSDEWGPDLAFVRVPETPFLQQIRANKSFLDITLDTEMRCAIALDDSSSFMIFSGFPACERFKGQPGLGFQLVEGLKGYGFATGQECYEARDGYDYVEVGASYEHGDNVPLTFKGVSGGGLWRVPLRAKKTEFGLTFDQQRPCLAGVVFYQGANIDGYRKLRAHGAHSLYNVFLPRLLNCW